MLVSAHRDSASNLVSACHIWGMSLPEMLAVAMRGTTQMKLSEQLGVAQTTLSAWLRRASKPTRPRLPAIAQALGVALDDLKEAVASTRVRRARHVAKRIRRGRA